jgi:hypothetical protein
MTNKDLPALNHDQQKAVLDTKKVLAAKEDVLKQLGQIEAFDFMSRLTTVATLRKLMIVKESKAYTGITFKNNEGELATVANWDEFCEHKLPWSRRTVDEKLQNLQVLGDEYFEAANKVGLSTKDMRALRALPDDERLQVLEHDALESGDKDVIREVIDDLHAKHKQEKRDLNSELKDTQADLSATRKLNTDQAKREEELMVKLEKAKYSPQEWPQHAKDLVEQVVLSSGKAFTGLDALDQLHTHIDTLTEQYADAAQVRHYAVKVYVHNLELVAERAAMLLMNAREYFPELDEPKPAEEVLTELDAIAQEKDHGTKAE